ncbi:hypothetical protein [Streptomyces sp. MP131-18]|uniref:hypothetical protein n=1 Tax=Streptomyces sp. MP131-18 TaxID=1857892 RepID=UPI00118066C1|nr:hypothetical protein [Streptomyces sp. MP131-18]
MRVLVPVLAGVVVACSGGAGAEEREYSVPEELCGLPIDVGSFDALFPPGEEMQVRDQFQRTGGHLLPDGMCTVTVDGDPAFHLALTPAYEGGVQEVVDKRRYEITDDTPDTLRIGPLAAIRYVECGDATPQRPPEYDYDGFGTSVGVEGDGGEDLSGTLEQVVGPLAEEVAPQVHPEFCDV